MKKKEDAIEVDAQDLTQNVEIDPQTGVAEPKDDDCDCNEDVVQKFSVENMNLSEEVEMIFSGQENVSEEFKTKVSTILETAVVSRINEEVQKIEDEAREAIEVRVALAEQQVDEKINAYLEDYVVPKWLEENKLAAETGIKNKIAEDFITDLRALLESYNINLSDEDADQIDEAHKMVEELKAEVNEGIEEVSALQKVIAEKDAEILEMKKEKVLASLSESLTVTQVEKLAKLAKEINATDIKVFEEKAIILKDSIFEKTSIKAEDKQDFKVEKVAEDKPVTDDYMNSLLNGIKRHNKKDFANF